MLPSNRRSWRPGRRPLLAAAAVTAVALGLGAAGCSSCSKGAPAGASRDDLALVPRDSSFVMAANFKKLRGSSLWKRIFESPDQGAEQKARYADFVKQTGLDPLQQIDSAFVALPSAGAAGEYAAILRGGPFDEAKLIAFMKGETQKDGGEIVVSEHQGRKRYTDSRSSSTFAVFLDPRTLLLASDGWSKKIIDLSLAGEKAQGESARASELLTALVKKTRTDDGLWGVGIVPPEARERLTQNPDLKSAGSMKDLFASADFSGGFKLDTVVDLGSEADAKDLTDRLKDQISQSRGNTQIQLMGLAHYFDGIKVSSQGPSLKLEVKLDQAGLDDLTDRLAGFVKNLGGGLAGAAPAVEPPPAAAPAPAAAPGK